METVTPLRHQGPIASHTVHTCTKTQPQLLLVFPPRPPNITEPRSVNFYFFFKEPQSQSLPLLVYTSWALTAKLSKQGQEVEARVQVEEDTDSDGLRCDSPELQRANGSSQDNPCIFARKIGIVRLFFFFSVFFYEFARPRRSEERAPLFQPGMEEKEDKQDAAERMDESHFIFPLWGGSGGQREAEK